MRSRKSPVKSTPFITQNYLNIDVFLFSTHLNIFVLNNIECLIGSNTLGHILRVQLPTEEPHIIASDISTRDLWTVPDNNGTQSLNLRRRNRDRVFYNCKKGIMSIDVVQKKNIITISCVLNSSVYSYHKGMVMKVIHNHGA